MTPRRLIEPARLAGTALLRGQSDARLVDLTRAGNEHAFEAIVHRYRRPLLRYCARILPPGRAEDAVQQAFLSAYKAIRDGDNELTLRPWLYRVARNSSLNLLRQNGWNHEQLHDDMDGVMRPDQVVEGRERIRSLVASVNGLPSRQRDAILLRELEGRSYEEIAVALGVTDGAVRQLLNRARTALRAGATALTPYGLAERLTEVAGGAGGVASLAKVGAAVLVAGAVATGTADQVLQSHGRHGAAGREAAADHRPPTADRSSPSPFAVRRARAVTSGAAQDPARKHGSSRRPGGGRRDDASALVDDRSTGGDRSGAGTSGGDERSGSGSSGSGTSGGGSGDSGVSGSSGSGSSGPGPGTEGGMTTSSSDGSSGTSGSSGPGSSDGGSTTTTTTTTTTSSTSGSGSGSGDGGSGELTSGGGTSGGSH